MQEMRRQVRLFPGTRLKVFDKKTGKLFGILADFSEEGFMLFSKKPYKVNVILRLQVNLPIFHHSLSETKITGDEKKMNFEAKSIWCRSDKYADGLYDIGFEFTNISQEDLQDFIQWHGFQSG